MSGDRNIILIVVDTLRYDFIGANGNTWISTPNMDRIAAESWIFDRCFSASYPTIPHRTDVLTGKCGGPEQVFNPWMPLRFDIVTLPQILAKSGYCTQLIHDTPHLINGGHNFDWPFHAWTMIRGAELDRPWINNPKPKLPSNWRYNSLFDFIDKSRIPYISYTRANCKRKEDQEWNVARLFLTASQWLKDNASRDNFFLWIDCFDPHEPWDVPPEFAIMYDKSSDYDGSIDPRSFSVQDLNRVPVESRVAVGKHLKALYSAKVSWVDRWLGVFLDTLDEVGLAENTTVILTSDHGTNVGERSQLGKRTPVKEQEGHVPLFIRVPEHGNGRNDLFVQPQDLFATILGVAGIKTLKPLLDSYDVLELATNKTKSKEGPRQVAISGIATTGSKSGGSLMWREPKDHVFTVFHKEYFLEFAPETESCRLTRYGELENVASSNESLVKEIRKTAIAELNRRETSPEIIRWLYGNGKTDLPKIKFPGPKGYDLYWRRSYNSW